MQLISRPVRRIELFVKVSCMHFLYLTGPFCFWFVIIAKIIRRWCSFMQFTLQECTVNYAINIIMQFADAKGWKSIALDTEKGFFLMFAFAISLASQHFHLLLRRTTFPFFVTNTDRGKEISQTALMGWLCKAVVFGDSLLVVHIQYLDCFTTRVLSKINRLTGFVL